MQGVFLLLEGDGMPFLEIEEQSQILSCLYPEGFDLKTTREQLLVEECGQIFLLEKQIVELYASLCFQHSDGEIVILELA